MVVPAAAQVIALEIVGGVGRPFGDQLPVLLVQIDGDTISQSDS